MTQFSIHSGLVCGFIKKVYRDGLDLRSEGEARKKITADLTWMQYLLFNLCSRHNFTVKEVLDANIAKLRDRQARGVLQGSGDNR